METLYEKYAVLDAKMKAIKAEKDIINAEIVEDILSRGEDKAETAVGKFKIIPLKKWVYTDKVAELEEAYKARKAQEESTGDATYVEEPSLRFSPIKL